MREGFDTPDDALQNLSPSSAVHFFRKLLYAEAWAVNATQSSAHVPTKINFPDGGLDAKVEDVKPDRDDLIPEGTSGIQIKASNASNIQPADCRDEVTDSDGEGLKPRISKLLNEGGVYILVVFDELVGRSSKPGKDMRESRLSALEDEFESHGYSDASVRVYDTSILGEIVTRFPSLVAELQGIDQAQPYSIWKEDITANFATFVADDKREAQIRTVQDSLQDTEDCQFIRVLGQPGIGKTRLVFEALSPDNLRSRVLYTEAQKFIGSPFAAQLRRSEDWHAIVVVDNCKAKDHETIRERFQGASDRLAFITISEDPTGVEYDHLLSVDGLSREAMRNLLSENTSVNATHRVADLTEGNPEFARFIVEKWKEADEDTDLLDVDNEWLFDRVMGTDEMNRNQSRQTKRVLEVFSLFDKIEWENERGEISGEAEFIAELAGFEGDFRTFQDIVSEQQERGTLQGEYYLSVTPFPLAANLLRSWIEANGPDGIEELLTEAPQEMVSRFGERIPYLSTTKAGKNWVSKSLSSDGPFFKNNGQLLETDGGSELFLRLTEAAPNEALDPLQHFFETREREQLLEFTTGRRNIIRSLKMIAVWKDTFRPAAKLMFRLAVAENDDVFSNNATGEFTNFYSPGFGPVAPTECPPTERLLILRENIDQGEREREVVLSAMETALTSPGRVTKIGTFEHQGPMGPPDLWTPETYGDLFDYYSEIVEILEEQLNSSSVENRTDALEVILGALRPIARMSESLSEKFREILVEVVDEDWVAKQEVIQSVRSFLKYEEEVLNEIEEEKEAWEEFLWEISERDFAGKLKRYVGTHTVEDRDIRDEKIREIAEEGAKDTDQLHQHLEWLLSYEPNGQALRNLGAELESIDDEREFLDEIIETFIQKESENRNVTLLAGYLSTLSDESKDIRQDAIEEVYTQISEYTDLVELIRLSGLTENDARRISGMVQDDKVGPSALAGFTYGGTSSNLPEDVLKEIVRYLLNNYSEGIQHIVPVYFHYYVFSDEEIKLPYDLTISLLSHPELTENPDAQIEIQGVTQDWMKVAEKLFEQYPKKRIPLIELAVDLLWRSSSIIGHSNGHIEFLSDVFDEEPRIVWTRFVEELEKRGYRYGVINWVGGMPITKLPTETFWEWIEEDPENNAPLAAQLIPSTLNHKEDEVSLARQLLVKYGDQEKVQYELASNYCSEAFSGPESEHYKKKKKGLEGFLEEESDENVTRWVRNRIEELEMKIERGKKREELLGISSN